MSDLFSRTKNHTLSPRSLMLNLKNNDTTPSLNIEQMLINWINTIGEPHCLLLEKLLSPEVIETGIIFIEILKNFLRHFGINDFNPDNRLTKEEKVNLVLTSLMELNKENNFDNFLRQQINYFFNHNKDIFKDKKELISFLEMLKNVYDKYGLNNEQVKYKKLSMDFNDNTNGKYYKFENKFLKSYNSNQKNDAFLQYELKHKKRKRFQSYFKNLSIQNNKNKLNFLLSPQIKEKTKKKNISSSLSPTHNITLSISPNNYVPKNILFKTKPKLIFNNYKSKGSDSIEKKNNSQSTNFNSVPSKKDNINNINSESNDDFNNKNDKKIFPLKNMIIGLTTKSFHYGENVNYYYISRPTKPIIDISINNNNGKIEKYTPPISKNIILNKDKIFGDDIKKIFDKQNESKCDKNINEKKIPKISNSIKNIIKNWLVSINLFQKNNITETSIIYLSHNGILFCDIINRCNNLNSNSIIKGIIKAPFTNSQKKLNIHKFFNYIYNNHKLYEYLKIYINFIEELIHQNEDVIFGILYGLYKYYNKDFKGIPYSKSKVRPMFKSEHNSKENSKEKNILKKSTKTLKSIRSWLGFSNNSINKVNKNIPKESNEESNFLNEISINNEFNLNNSIDNKKNEKCIKRKSFIKINPPSVSECSSIGVNPSITK